MSRKSKDYEKTWHYKNFVEPESKDIMNRSRNSSQLSPSLGDTVLVASKQSQSLN